MREEVSFRRATRKDVGVLVRFRIEFLNELMGITDKKIQAPRKKIHNYFSEAMDGGDFIAWLAQIDGAVVATSGMVIWQMPPKYGIANGKQGYILNMYTLPWARRRGICTVLLQRLISDAHTLGIKYLHLHASDDGIGIYRKAGFREPSWPELELTLGDAEP
ncbi:GNAT family N-acetyltransferase [candidate division WOR-3 bacterium]|nr:GNAT family N-acetyltransferase [candidate division WOR-3 bacterium]